MTSLQVMNLDDRGFFDLGDMRLEYRMIGPRPAAAPTLVLLHAEHGSAAGWGRFADELAAATDAGVLAFSRPGKQAAASAGARPVSAMKVEACSALPRLLDAAGFRRGLLVGHGDGAAVAAIYGGSVQDHRIRGLVLIAPRRLAEEDTPEALAHIRVPILVIHGANDTATASQIALAREECYCPVEVASVPAAREAPHLEAQAATLAAVSGFVIRLLESHGERREPPAAAGGRA
jgi:pimeloyl-ACP methyl ester carboxylesterase